MLRGDLIPKAPLRTLDPKSLWKICLEKPREGETGKTKEMEAALKCFSLCVLPSGPAGRGVGTVGVSLELLGTPPAPSLHRAGNQGILPFYVFVYLGSCPHENSGSGGKMDFAQGRSCCFGFCQHLLRSCSLQEPDLGAANPLSPSKMRIK